MESGFNHLHLNTLNAAVPGDFRYLVDNKKPIYLEVEVPCITFCGILNTAHISEFEAELTNIRCYSGTFTVFVENAPEQMTILLIINMDTGEMESVVL